MISHCVYDTKVNVGSKCVGEEWDEDFDVSRKLVKMRDLHSLLQSQDTSMTVHATRVATYEPMTSKMEDIEEEADIVGTQGSQIVDKNAVGHTDARLLKGADKKSSTLSRSKPLDLNSDFCTDENSGYNDAVICLGDPQKQELYGKEKATNELDRNSLHGLQMNLNAEEVTSSTNHDLFTYRPHNNLKTRDMLGENDALRKWKEMKENGFMSLSYGGIPPPVANKQRGRKRKTEVLKQKVEHSKMNQVDRLAKIAAPTGLLKGLNPGIINHVRNSKQVHSIIQALVRSEQEGNVNQSSETKAVSLDLRENDRSLENVYCSEVHVSGLSYGFGSLGSLPETVESTIDERRFSAHLSLVSQENNSSEDDKLTLKLASSYMVSENTSCLSTDESTSVDTLSVKAATVASQWLQLLHQDIKGRLAALSRSKQRVCAVITTELPFLLSKEFESNQENTPSVTKDHVSSCSLKELHQAHWNKLFNQMEASLSEEEKQLESWLNEVIRMIQLCDQGLQHVQWNKAFEMQRLGDFNDDFRSKIIDPKNELSVRAAAASIYSTCNHVSSTENLTCC